MDDEARPGLAHGGDLTHQIIGLAMRVHTRLGPGLLESTYEKCLCYELRRASIPFDTQVALPIHYDGHTLEAVGRVDLIVDGPVCVELKSVEQILPVHEAQLLTYLRFSPCRIGLLINFNTVSLKHGIRRRVL